MIEEEKKKLGCFLWSMALLSVFGLFMAISWAILGVLFIFGVIR